MKLNNFSKSILFLYNSKIKEQDICKKCKNRYDKYGYQSNEKNIENNVNEGNIKKIKKKEKIIIRKIAIKF